MYAVGHTYKKIHLVAHATAQDAQIVAKSLGLAVFTVHATEVRKEVFVGPCKGDTEECWVTEYSYRAVSA